MGVHVPFLYDVTKNIVSKRTFIKNEDNQKLLLWKNQKKK